MFRGMVISVVVCSALAACSATNRSAPAPTAMAVRRNVPHPHWQPKHKGGADLSTGVYVREDDDLVVDTPFPIVLRRTYNSLDGHPRQFGADTTHPGEWWIYGDGDPSVPWGDLILADGGRIHFVRTSPGRTREGAILRHDATPTEFNGALLVWTGSLWEMRFVDGSTASFLDCRGKRTACSLVERHDPDGHRIAYVRDPAGTLLRMEAEGQAITFDYDDHKRIVRARDTLGRDMKYTYDDRGRLVRAAGSDDVIRTYEYNDQDKMTAVREPGRILTNSYDENGRWTGQVVKASETDDDPYVASARYVVENGSIVRSDFDEGASVAVVHYNPQHYILSETFDAHSASPIAFVYDRDPVSNAVREVTLSCAGPSGMVIRPVPLSSANDDAGKAMAVRENCLSR